MLTDLAGRNHTYLRISLTDRCNLQCRYCMPAEGIQLLPREQILQPEEIGVLAQLFVDQGIRKIRLTGGEPLIRNGLEVILEQLQHLQPAVDLALTTNGVLLAKWLPHLAEAGIHRINISLDSLHRERYRQMTGIDGLADVWAGFQAALEHPKIEQVKLNVVVQRGINDDEIPALANLTKTCPVDVRFIEMMPVAGITWSPQNFATRSEILEKLGSDLVADNIEAPDRGPADHFRLPGAQGRIGVISSLSLPRCDQCNRLRINAQGQLLRCLYDAQTISLRDLLRSGYPEAEIIDSIRQYLEGKHDHHAIRENLDLNRHSPCLAAVGG